MEHMGPNKEMEIYGCDIQKVKNGYIVSCDYREPSNGSGSFEHREHKSMKEVFTSKQEKKAWEKYKEFKMKAIETKYNNKDVY